MFQNMETYDSGFPLRIEHPALKAKNMFSSTWAASELHQFSSFLESEPCSNSVVVCVSSV